MGMVACPSRCRQRQTVSPHRARVTSQPNASFRIRYLMSSPPFSIQYLQSIRPESSSGNTHRLWTTFTTSSVYDAGAVLSCQPFPWSFFSGITYLSTWTSRSGSNHPTSISPEQRQYRLRSFPWICWPLTRPSAFSVCNGLSTTNLRQLGSTPTPVAAALSGHSSPTRSSSWSKLARSPTTSSRSPTVECVRFPEAFIRRSAWLPPWDAILLSAGKPLSIYTSSGNTFRQLNSAGASGEWCELFHVVHWIA